MADTYTSTTLPAELLRFYDRNSHFEPLERSATRTWDDMQEADDIKPLGSGFFFRVVGAKGHAQGTPAEGGDWSASHTRLQVECSVQSAQIDSTVRLSSKFIELAEDDGSYSSDAEHDAIVEATEGLFSLLNRYLVSGHGTGRLGVVLSSVVASTTVVCKQPEGAMQFRPNQPIEFADLDVGGSVVAQAVITDVNYLTHTLTLDTAVTVSANYSIYQQGTYGLPKPNGFRNIIDDGDFATSIFNVPRAAPNTYLNGLVMDGTGTLQDYSDELLRDLIYQITMKQKYIPTELVCNYGMTDEYLRIAVRDRVFMQTGDIPKYETGGNVETLSFTFGNTKIPFKPDGDAPAREIYAVYKPGWRKHTLRKADWYRPGGGSPFMPMPADAGGTWTYTIGASMMMDMTFSHRNLNAQGALKNVRDRMTARDT